MARKKKAAKKKAKKKVAKKPVKVTAKVETAPEPTVPPPPRNIITDINVVKGRVMYRGYVSGIRNDVPFEETVYGHTEDEVRMKAGQLLGAKA